MNGSRIKKTVLVERFEYISEMIAEIKWLHLEDEGEFCGDRRNFWAAE